MGKRLDVFEEMVGVKAKVTRGRGAKVMVPVCAQAFGVGYGRVGVRPQ